MLKSSPIKPMWSFNLFFLSSHSSLNNRWNRCTGHHSDELLSRTAELANCMSCNSIPPNMALKALFRESEEWKNSKPKRQMRHYQTRFSTLNFNPPSGHVVCAQHFPRITDRLEVIFVFFFHWQSDVHKSVTFRCKLLRTHDEHFSEFRKKKNESRHRRHSASSSEQQKQQWQRK